MSLMMAVIVMRLSAAQYEQGKEGEAYNPGGFFQSKTVIIPHDTKLDRGGEDSADASDTLLTVADGVGVGVGVCVDDWVGAGSSLMLSTHERIELLPRQDERRDPEQTEEEGEEWEERTRPITDNGTPVTLRRRHGFSFS